MCTKSLYDRTLQDVKIVSGAFIAFFWFAVFLGYVCVFIGVRRLRAKEPLAMFGAIQP